MKFKRSFGEHLEQYVFSVAAKFIDLVDSKVQTELIELISRITQSTTPTDSSVTPTNVASSNNTTPALPTNLYTTQLERQWLAALKQPLEPIPVAKPLRPVQYLLISLQARIDLTIFRIGKVDQLVESAGLNQADRANTARPLAHYGSVKKKFVAYLAKLEVQHKKELLRLSGL